MKLQFLSLFSFLLCVSPAHAQESEAVSISDSTYSLPEIRIQSTRYTPVHHAISGRFAVLDREKIKSSGGQSLGEVLQRAAGVFVRQYGSGLSTLSIRGGNSSHAIITLDGMPLYDPQLGQVDLSLVPSMLLENISILYGQSSSMYGANGFSGVVDIETRRLPSMPLAVSGNASLGAFSDRQADISLGFRKNSVSGLFAIRFGGEQGDFSYKDPSLFPVETVKRQGADQKFSSYFGKLDWINQRSYSALSIWLNRYERGIPGPITLQFRDERQWDDLFRVNFGHVHRLRSSSIAVRSGLQKMSLRYSNPLLQVDDTGHTSSFTVDTYYQRQSRSKNTIKVGIDNAIRSARHPKLSSKAKEFQTGVYFVGEQKLGRLILLPSMRADRYLLPNDKQVTATSPNLGMNLNVPFVSPLYLKAQAGKSFKVPTFNDRFWQPGGNDELNSEIGWGYEAGALWNGITSNKNIAWSSEITAYRQHIRDQIVWLPTSQGYWAPVNEASVLISGVESSLRMEPVHSSHFNSHLEAIFHLTETQNRSDPAAPSFNQPLRYSPRHVLKVNVGGSKSLGQWIFGADVYSRYVSKRYVTEDGSSALPGYWTADVRIHSHVFTKSSEISLHIFMENVFDRDYEIIKGYVMPPRLLRIELELKWPGDPHS